MAGATAQRVHRAAIAAWMGGKLAKIARVRVEIVNLSAQSDRGLIWTFSFGWGCERSERIEPRRGVMRGLEFQDRTPCATFSLKMKIPSEMIIF